VQAELVELSGLQDKIFLNSNAYSSSITGAYTGAAAGGLGVTGGRSKDGRYTLSVSVSGASFTLTATPVSGSTQAGDGNVSITSTNLRLWGDKAW
jgi:type IV pilus assembly protein PilE